MCTWAAHEVGPVAPPTTDHYHTIVVFCQICQNWSKMNETVENKPWMGTRNTGVCTVPCIPNGFVCFWLGICPICPPLLNIESSCSTVILVSLRSFWHKSTFWQTKPQMYCIITKKYTVTFTYYRDADGLCIKRVYSLVFNLLELYFSIDSTMYQLAFWQCSILTWNIANLFCFTVGDVGWNLFFSHGSSFCAFHKFAFAEMPLATQRATLVLTKLAWLGDISAKLVF